MGIELIPKTIQQKYDVFEWNHAIAILKTDFPDEWSDIVQVLDSYTLKKSEILQAGGRKSPIAGYLDDFLYQRGWEEKKFNITINVDEDERETPTHKIDCYKNRIGVE